MSYSSGQRSLMKIYSEVDVKLTRSQKRENKQNYQHTESTGEQIPKHVLDTRSHSSGSRGTAIHCRDWIFQGQTTLPTLDTTRTER